jgi:hypothetical protein
MDPCVYDILDSESALEWNPEVVTLTPRTLCMWACSHLIGVPHPFVLRCDGSDSHFHHHLAKFPVEWYILRKILLIPVSQKPSFTSSLSVRENTSHKFSGFLHELSGQRLALISYVGVGAWCTQESDEERKWPFLFWEMCHNEAVSDTSVRAISLGMTLYCVMSFLPVTPLVCYKPSPFQVACSTVRRIRRSYARTESVPSILYNAGSISPFPNTRYSKCKHLSPKPIPTSERCVSSRGIRYPP